MVTGLPTLSVLARFRRLIVPIGLRKLPKEALKLADPGKCLFTALLVPSPFSGFE